MNDAEIFKADSDAKPNIEVEVAENDIEPDSDKPVKKERKKRVLSDERKAVLREQLKKGRETSMLNRQKKSLANKLSKKEANDANDAILAESLLKRYPSCSASLRTETSQSCCTQTTGKE